MLRRYGCRCGIENFLGLDVYRMIVFCQPGNNRAQFVCGSATGRPRFLILQFPRWQDEGIQQDKSHFGLRVPACVENRAVVRFIVLFQRAACHVIGADENTFARDAKFTPIQIELKEPYDINKAKIKFIYSAADPKSVSRAAGGGTPSDPFKYTLGVSDKHLRIWKKDFPTIPASGTTSADFRNEKNVSDKGDYVNDAVDLDWSSIATGRTAKLYLEAVSPSAALGDLSVEIVVTQDGVETRDTVNLTSVYFKDASLVVTANADADYGRVNNVLATIGGIPAVSIEVSNKFQPDGVDSSVEPLLNIRAAIMQNVVSNSTILDLHNIHLENGASGTLIPYNRPSL